MRAAIDEMERDRGEFLTQEQYDKISEANLALISEAHLALKQAEARLKQSEGRLESAVHELRLSIGEDVLNIIEDKERSEIDAAADILALVLKYRTLLNS